MWEFTFYLERFPRYDFAKTGRKWPKWANFWPNGIRDFLWFWGKWLKFWQKSKNGQNLASKKAHKMVKKIKTSLIPSVIFKVLPISTHWPKISPFWPFLGEKTPPKAILRHHIYRTSQF